MSDTPISTQTESSYCKFCREALKNKQDIDSGRHSSCESIVTRFQDDYTKNIVQRLIEHYDLTSKDKIIFNEQGEVIHLELEDEIIEDVYLLTSLESLDLSWNELEDVDPRLFEMPNLKRLNLEGNDISQLPETMPTKPAPLEYLNLGFNRYLNVPMWISKLPKLKTLYLHGVEFDAFPTILKDMQVPILEEISLSMYYDRIPKWFVDKIVSGLRVLDEYKTDPKDEYGELRPFVMNADFWVGYLKCGNDLSGNYGLNDEGKIDGRKTLINYLGQMESVVQNIKNAKHEIDFYFQYAPNLINKVIVIYKIVPMEQINSVMEVINDIKSQQYYLSEDLQSRIEEGLDKIHFIVLSDEGPKSSWVSLLRKAGVEWLVTSSQSKLDVFGVLQYSDVVIR